MQAQSQNQDHNNQYPPQSEINNNQPTYSQQPIPLQKSSNKKTVTIVIIVITIFLIMIGAFAFLFFTLFSRLSEERPLVDSTITNFMISSSEENWEQAYTYTSSEFREHIDYEEFIGLMNLNREQFEGYISHNIHHISYNRNTGQLPRFECSAIVNYDDGSKGEMEALLVKEGDQWFIQNIGIKVTFERMERFRGTQEQTVLGVIEN